MLHVIRFKAQYWTLDGLFGRYGNARGFTAIATAVITFGVP
jgi:hypothetical protein